VTAYVSIGREITVVRAWILHSGVTVAALARSCGVSGTWLHHVLAGESCGARLASSLNAQTNIPTAEVLAGEFRLGWLVPGDGLDGPPLMLSDGYALVTVSKSVTGIEAYRLYTGLSLTEIGRRAGVERHSVSDAARGYKCGPRTAARLAEVTELDLTRIQRCERRVVWHLPHQDQLAQAAVAA
jgi:hypothetical protein